MLNVFRFISALEGFSFLALLTLVYGFEAREHIFMVGMGHGVLFMLYFVFSLIVSHKLGLSVLFWVVVLLAAVVPFAFVALEWKLGEMNEGRVNNSL